jgi:hypothetical protein
MILDKDNICREIEIARASGLSTFDSVMEIFDKYNISIDFAGEIINRSIKDKIKTEAMNRGLMKRTSILLDSIE